MCVRFLYDSQVLFDGFTKKKFADRTVESFAVFKDGITPEWEDPENKHGGEWSIRKGMAESPLALHTARRKV